MATNLQILLVIGKWWLLLLVRSHHDEEKFQNTFSDQIKVSVKQSATSRPETGKIKMFSKI